MRTTTLLALLIPAASYSWINIQDDTTKPDTVAECAEPARRNDAVTIDPEVTGPVAETDPTTPSLPSPAPARSYRGIPDPNGHFGFDVNGSYAVDRDIYEHLVRYYRDYSNRSRGARRIAKQNHDPAAATVIDDSPVDTRRKDKWARLIQKVYEVDPLECIHCGAAMRVIALIEDPELIKRILRHLDVWDPLTATVSSTRQFVQCSNLPVTARKSDIVPVGPAAYSPFDYSSNVQT